MSGLSVAFTTDGALTKKVFRVSSREVLDARPAFVDCFAVGVRAFVVARCTSQCERDLAGILIGTVEKRRWLV